MTPEQLQSLKQQIVSPTASINLEQEQTAQQETDIMNENLGEQTKKDAKAENKSQQQAGDDPRNEQIADGLFGQQAIQDQQQAWRDQHAQNRRSSHNTNCKSFVISMPRHFRHRDAGKHGSGCDGNSGDGCENRICAHGSNAKATANAPKNMVCHIKSIASHASDGHNKPHHDEQRHHTKEVAGDGFRCCQSQQFTSQNGRSFDHPDPNKRRQHQRDWHPQAKVDHHDHGAKGRHTNFKGAHVCVPFFANRRNAAVPACRVNCTSKAAHPISMISFTGQIGAVKSPTVPS